MVLTDLPFERSSLIHNRYSLLRRPDSAPVPIKEEEGKKKISKEYAAFLKEHERKAGLDGFVDSNKYSHSYMVKKEKDKERARSSSENRASVVHLKARVEKDKKDYDRRIKVIEDHMWQHKQEERELKRTEGDIVKNQRAVRQTLRDYENAITKKRMEEEKKLNTGLEKYTKLQREQTHKKEDTLKQRTERGIIKLQQNKSLGRKVTLKSSDIERKYHTKLSDLELKRIEVMRLSQEFENKMRQKEEEQYRLKAELAELAIALNMEAQKGRVHKYDAERDRRKEIVTRINEDLTTDQSVESKLAKSEGDTKAAEMNKRKLSADMLLTRSHLSIKQRDEQRHLTDTQMRLADNSNVQRQLNEAAFHAEMDLKARQIDQKVEAHNTRRVSQLQTSMKQKKEKEESQQRELEEKFRRRQAEEQRKQHEDSLKFFKKMVSKGEDLEQMLYGKVRNCEYNRQKQEQNVRRIHQALSDLRKKNASKVKEEIAECFQLEKELEQKLLKEKAELDKVHAEREESYFRLQKHRQILREDKHNLVEHEREHTRLVRIGSRSDSYLTD